MKNTHLEKYPPETLEKGFLEGINFYPNEKENKNVTAFGMFVIEMSFPLKNNEYKLQKHWAAELKDEKCFMKNDYVRIVKHCLWYKKQTISQKGSVWVA